MQKRLLNPQVQRLSREIVMSKKFTLALVTGASSGIGEALCRLLASKGIELILSGRNQAKLQEIAAGLPTHAEIIPADLANGATRSKIIEKIQQRVPDLVINNAGFGLYGEALSHSTKDQMEILAVNGNAVLEITLEAARAMINASKKGVILNVSSAAAMQVFPYFAVYSAAKTFVNQFSESLDWETRYHGVRILTSCPGMVATDFPNRAAKRPIGRQSDAHTMTAAYAAQEIWHQIETEKPLHIFNWRYRLATFASRYLIPKSWVAHTLRNNIRSRLQ